MSQVFFTLIFTITEQIVVALSEQWEPKAHIYNYKCLNIQFYFNINSFGLCYSVKKEKPVIVMSPDKVEATEKEIVRFESTVTGEREPIVEWLVSNKIID